MNRMRLPVDTCSSSMPLVDARSDASTSPASASEKSSSAGVTPSCPAIWEYVNASASGGHLHAL